MQTIANLDHEAVHNVEVGVEVRIYTCDSMQKRTKFNDCDVLYTLNVFLRSSNIGIFVAKINSYHTFFFFVQRVHGKHTTIFTRTDRQKKQLDLEQSYMDTRRVSSSKGSYFYCEAL